MKKYHLFLFALLCVSFGFAQSNYINYKALIKDTNGNVLANQTLDFSIAILKTDPNTGTVVYVENHAAVSTDANGIIILDIGSGTPDFGTFDNIDWASDRHFISIGMDSGSGPIALGTTEFKAVPYALTAGNTVFSTTANVTSNVKGDLDNDDFVFGSDRLSHNKPPGTEEYDYRIFFDKSKGAFRAGSTRRLPTNEPFPNDGSAWDDLNIGIHSFATGYNTVASGRFSTASGNISVASGTYAIALGSRNQASGNSAVALGNQGVASGVASLTLNFDNVASGSFTTAMGLSTRAEAIGVTAIGYYNIGGGNPTQVIDTDPLFEIGNGANTNNRSNALTILKNGTITAPSLDIAEITDDKALLTKEYFETNSGPFSTVSSVTSNANGSVDTDDFVFGSTQLAHSLPANASDNRMFFDKSNGAFRVGTTEISDSSFPYDGTAWNEGNLGLYSFASGVNTVASGTYSLAMGYGSLATEFATLAFGFESKATATSSIAMGEVSEANGASSTAIGYHTRANAARSTAFGYFNVGGGNPSSLIDTDPLFEIGNGLDSNDRSNALTILKNGTTTINGRTIVEESTPSNAFPAFLAQKTHTGEVDAIGVLGENTVSDYFGIGVLGRAGYKGVEGSVVGTGSGVYFGTLGVSQGSNSGSNYGLYGSAGNGSTNYAVYAQGDIAYTGTLINASDKALKTNIQAMNNTLKTIMKLKPSQYNFKGSYQKRMNISSKPQFGFIAQELQSVLPELVSNNVRPGVTKKDPSINYLGVNYIGLIPILTSGIQEQQTKIESLEAQLLLQKQMIQSLLLRVKALEN